MNINNIKLGYSSLSDSIFIYRHGKDPKVALDKREAEADVMSVLVQHMMKDASKGSQKEVSFGDKKFSISVTPI